MQSRTVSKSLNVQHENNYLCHKNVKKKWTYSTFFAHSGGLLRVMNEQLVRMVNMINMLNSVETKSRNTVEHLCLLALIPVSC